jgi:hypothetical protein
MGIDASLFFYRGPALRVDEAVQPLRAVLEGRLGTITLAVAHIANAAGEIHALALFERAEHALRVERAAIDEAARDAAAPSRSLASVVQAAWRVARAGTVETSPSFRAPDPPDAWPELVVLEISRVRPGALWASACDHSLIGGYAHAEAGRIVASQMLIDGDGYEREPDAALAQFTGDPTASVLASLEGPLDAPREGLSFAVVAERGRFLDRPRPTAPSALREFQHVLRSFGDSVVVVRG